jgi:importin-5
MKAMRSDPLQSPILFQGLQQSIDTDSLTIRTLACILLKKLYLDDRTEEEKCVQLNPDELATLRNKIENQIDMEKEPMTLIRRKAEIICKLYKKQGDYSELIAKLQMLAAMPSDSEVIVKMKEFAMYMFELLAEYHLPQELIVSNQDSFMSLFS